MATIAWTPTAHTDYAEAITFIRGESPAAAERFVRHVDAAIERLTAFPGSGRIVPEYGRPDVREVFVERYRLVYRVRGTAIEVLLLRHGSRPLPALG